MLYAASELVLDDAVFGDTDSTISFDSWNDCKVLDVGVPLELLCVRVFVSTASLCGAGKGSIRSLPKASVDRAGMPTVVADLMDGLEYGVGRTE